jgi:hypothetical protein
MFGDCLLGYILKNCPNIQMCWLIRLQHVSILWERPHIVLRRLWNQLIHCCRDVWSTYHAVQGSDLINCPVLVEFTHAVIIATRTLFSTHVRGTQFWLSRRTHANPRRGVLNTPNICIITAWFRAVKFWPVLATLGVVTNTE